MPTAVLKKRSPDGSLTVYLSRRELVLPAEEEGNTVRPLEGVALLGRTLESAERVFALLVLTFRYGREDEEVMGLKFYTEAVLHYQQVVPSNGENKRLTLLQQHLIRKLGPGAHPLTVSASGHLPHSVALRPARMYGGSPLGVTYDLKVFIGMRPDERPSKRELVRMGLRCLHRSLPPQPNPPYTELNRAFLLSSGRIRLEARLDREAYRRTDPIRVHVSLDNSSNRTVHRLSVRIVQHVHVCMFTSGRFKNQVAFAEAERPVRPGACLSRVFQLSVQQEQQMRYPVALAVEGGPGIGSALKLAPSTVPRMARDSGNNPYGVTVRYEVKVKAMVGVVDRPLVLRLPFRLLEDPPSEEEEEEGPVPLAEEEEEESLFPT